MKKILCLFLLMTGSLLSLQAQSEEANVTEVVNRLFKAMYTNDTALFRTAFADRVTMATVAKNKEGKTILEQETGIEGFLEAIAKPNPKGALTEEIWNVKVDIDGDFAQVWCDYALYVGNTFIHCGVDAFHMVKKPDGWKIFFLSDTRRRNGCNVPQNIQDKHKQ